ncbi:unnamed protein product [Eruca vesicaria subsp. sativa]|uniref:Uncharacterized protein n=1 Tax=Eruca vesicaria subsp. sativa TaxID=29727 RepID=A0ABC8J321_ERUVS|nr:unnamed protein product [Eruca vesicaria subsp. sativa]
MIACIASRIALVCLGVAWAKVVVAQSDARIFFSNSVVIGKIYPLDSEVRVCDESRTEDVATVELREGDVFWLIIRRRKSTILRLLVTLGL